MKWRCQKVLPTVYDESLSYYEQVCKLVKMVEDLEKGGYAHYLKFVTDGYEVLVSVYGDEGKIGNAVELSVYMTSKGIEELGCNGNRNGDGVYKVKAVSGGLVGYTYGGNQFAITGECTDVVV